MIARQDEKAYRLTVVLGGLAIALALQGRVGEASALFDEAKAANPAFRESILVEMEAVVRWIAGDFAAALGLAREAVAWQPAATARRRAIGPVFGALAAIETDDVVEARRLLARAQAVYGGRDWSFFLPITRWAEGVLAWHAGGAAEGVAALRPAAARLSDMQARTWAAFALFDLAEAAADAGDVAAATAAAEELSTVADVVALPLYRGLAAAGSACAALAGGDGEQAVEPAREAITLLSTVGCTAHLARAHQLLGRSLPADERPQAVAALERAADDVRAVREHAGAGNDHSRPCAGSAAPGGARSRPRWGRAR